MATNTFGPHNGAGRIAPATIDLGTDGEGRRHVYRRSTHAVHVITGDGERVHVARLGDRELDAWMEWIGENFGWDPQRYGLNFGDMLAEALE